MVPDIPKKIKEIEKEYGIRIILAVENGARNWGLASPISDYDVRYLFHYSMKRYLSVTKPIPGIRITDGDLDLDGFDIYKFAFLLAKSNANIVEWMTSKIVYYEVESGFLDMARNFAQERYNPLALYYHYHSLGYNNYKDLIEEGDEEDATPKTYLYALRGLFNALYVLKNKTIPPTDFKVAITETELLPQWVRETLLEKIIPAKIEGRPAELGKRSVRLDEYLRKQFKKRKSLHKEAHEVMKRKEPLPINIDDLIYKELVKYVPKYTK